MSRKYSEIVNLYHHTLKQMTQSPVSWQGFLKSAGRNYKIPFNEQLLVYAQKPDATAVLELDKWNKLFGRYVKRGSHGIAVFDGSSDYEKIKYFFDISDTVAGKEEKVVPLWEIEDDNRSAVLSKLAESYGVDGQSDYEKVIQTAQSLASSHIEAFLPNLLKNRTGSYLESIDETTLRADVETFLSNSTAYMLMNRCGLDADKHFNPNDFSFILDCDTVRLTSTIGKAVSDVSEIGLKKVAQINKEILLEKTVANKVVKEYNSNKEQSVGGINYGNQESAEKLHERGNGNQLHTAGRVLSSELDSERTDGGRETTAQSLGTETVRIPERTPVRNIHRDDVRRDSLQTSARDRRSGIRENGNTGEADFESRGADGGHEEHRYVEVGGSDEQYPQPGGGNRDERANLQLNDALLPSVEEQQSTIQEAEEDKTSAFSISQEDIDHVLLYGSGYEHGKYRIYEQFQRSEDGKANIAFLKKECNFYNRSHTYLDGTRGEVSYSGKGISFNKHESAKNPVLLLTWIKVENRLCELIRNGRYLSPKEKEEYALYQEMQIQQAIKSERQQFINQNRDVPTAEKRDTLALRLSDFIRDMPGYEKKFLDDYGLQEISSVNADEMKPHLQNPEEVDRISAFLKKVQGATSGVFERSNAWAFQAELNELFEKQLVYQVGDTVYIGSTEYDILQIHDDSVLLYDNSFPLMNKEMGKKEFEVKISKNTSNSHLMKFVEEENPELTQAKQLINEFLQRDYNDDKATADFSDLSKVDVAYTTTEDEKHEIQASVNLLGFSLDIYMDNNLIKSEKHDSLKSLIGRLANLDFDELVYLEAEDMALGEQKALIHEPESEYQLEYSYVNDRLLVRNSKDSNPDTISPNVARIEPDGSIIILDESLPERERLAIQEVAENDLDRYRAESESHLQDMLDYAEQTAEEMDSYVDQDSNILSEVFDPKKPQKAKLTTFHAEIPQSERHQFQITDDTLGTGSRSEKFANNVLAIATLKECERESRLASTDEQVILSRYVGWGGLPEYFEEEHSSYGYLKSLLTPEEYAQARESSLTAFYTPPIVIRSIYDFYEKIGFKGNLLEPACGTGNFIGMIPEKIQQDSKIYGIELDSITGRIAQQLYQKSNIAVQGFEKTEAPDSFFDGAVGNVPFGDFSVMDSRYNTLKLKIHDYFFAKTLDKLRPGGVMAFITSKGTLDKKTGKFRKYLSQRADLLGAIRLPNNTFKANAGTEVTSDIIFLQKRDRMIDIDQDWIHLGLDENGISMNSYFVEHPEMILGKMEMVSGPFGPETTCSPTSDSLEEQLKMAVEKIQADFVERDIAELEQEDDLDIPAHPNLQNYSFGIVQGTLYYRENSRMKAFKGNAKEEERIRGMAAIRDSVRELIHLQTEDYPERMIHEEQQKLNKLYDSFTKKNGLLSSKANQKAFNSDGSYAVLAALENLDEDGNLKSKSAIFTKRTIKPKQVITYADTAQEALALSIGEKACVDIPYMCQLTGKTELQIYTDLQGVIFLNPSFTGAEDSHDPKYLPADEYLSGDVKTKLELANERAKQDSAYKINVQYLEKVIPKDLTAAEISVNLSSAWLPKDIVEQFVNELLTPSYTASQRIKITYFKPTAEWTIYGKSMDNSNIKVNQKYGSKRANAYSIIQDTLNLKDSRVYDYVEENGKNKAVLNPKETAIAQSKQQLIKEAFKDWIWKDQSRRQQLVSLYNEKFNRVRPREYDGSHIQFVGMNAEIQLKPHQKNAVARMLYGGNTLLAHVVGAGKTFEMVAAAQESKRLGLCQKSLFIVPNHLTEQWAGEYLLLYPGANILVSTKKDFETLNRKKFCARIATGDYDAIIIGTSQFEKIPVSVERQEAFVNKQLDEIMQGIEQAKRDNSENYTIKKMEKSRKQLEVKLEKLSDQSRKDDIVTFEQLGVDRIFVDEAHYYKNLYLQTKMRNVAGIAQTEAKKSSDLFVKCQYLDELTGGKGVIFATGTPISNSMTELYTMQRYLQYHKLVEMGLEHFDSWASTFGETVTAIELAPEGTGYRAKTRFAKFHNLPELICAFKEVADIQTADMLKLPVPDVEYHNIALKPSEFQREIVLSLADRAEAVRGGVDPSIDNMLKITNDGRKLALDQRLVNDLLPDNEDGKISACADNVHEIWQNTATEKSTQLVFCDLSTPGGKHKPIEMEEIEGVWQAKQGQFTNVYEDLRYKLIAKGIPENEIAFIHDANTEIQKKDLFNKVISGQIRVLLGSTMKMGAGTNVQEKLIALHHLDCPWRPSDLQQREGRIIRQGNNNPKVHIFTYVTENTFDAYLYQLVENKQKFISQIMTSRIPVRSAEDLDETALTYAEIKSLATGDPHIKEKMDLDIQVSKLKMLKANFLSEKYELEDNLAVKYPQEVNYLNHRIKGLQADIQQFRDNKLSADEFKMIVKGQLYTDKREAGEEIIKACRLLVTPDPVDLGFYQGFQMMLSYDSFAKEHRITLKHELPHVVWAGSDPFGNITRLNNLLDGLEDSLEQAQNKLQEIKNQIEVGKAEIEKPWQKEDELKEKTERLSRLNALLNVENKTIEEMKDKQKDDFER